MGKRDEEMKRRLDQIKQEKLDLLKNKLNDLGLAETEQDIPPDDVDQKEVERTMAYSLLSLIPYTQAWYESRAAEEEMDNLKKIRIERAKAEDFVAMTKMGKHEDALKAMMTETNRDFHFFNKLKTKLIEEGKFKEEENERDPFKDIERGRNRIKKAFRRQFALIDDSLQSQLKSQTRSITESDDARRKRLKSTPCIWR